MDFTQDLNNIFEKIMECAKPTTEETDTTKLLNSLINLDNSFNSLLGQFLLIPIHESNEADKKEIDKILILNKNFLIFGLFSLLLFCILLVILLKSFDDNFISLFFLCIIVGLLSLVLLLIFFVEYIRIRRFKKYFRK